ncbi:MAG: lysyl oxidase family protein [Haloechinothrix sp.]
MSDVGNRQVRPGRFAARAVPAGILIAGVIAGSAGTSAGAESDPLLPDLVADAATSPAAVIYQDSSGTRWLLRFNGYVHNGGDGALELRGSSPASDEMSVVQQRVHDSAGGFEDQVNSPAPRVIFEDTDGHNHWHLRNAAGYSLWNDAGTAEVAPSQKVGFCLIDSTHVDPWGPSSAFYTLSSGSFCAHDESDASTVTMGVSAGWRDYYDRSLPFQWVDISDVLPGNYSLKSEVDPDGVIAEANEENAPAFADAVVPGYLSTSFTAQVPRILPAVVALQARQFGSPSARQFRIDQAPKNGSLNKPTEVWFDDTSIVYTPKFFYTGPDSFRFSAREKNNPFPRSPHSAVASLGVGGAAAPVAASGPEPTRSAVTAEPRRAPDVQGALPAPDGSALAVPQVAVEHGDLIVRTVAWRSGSLRIAAIGGGLAGHRCQAAVPRGQAFTCLLATGVGQADLHGARIVATLRSGDQVLGSREVPLP